MLLPIRTNMPLRSTPVVNYLLLITNIAVFLATLHQGRVVIPQSYALQANYPQFHQFLTHAFLHASWLHLAGNMLFLYIFGNNVNDRLGNIGYLVFYLAAAFFAGLGHVVMEQTPAVGASGAIAAVTGMYLILLGRTKITMLYWLFLFIGTFEITALLFIALYFGIDLYYTLNGSPEQIAYSAHVAGYLFGFTTGLLLLTFRLIQRSNYDLLSFFSRTLYRVRVATTPAIKKQDFTSSEREALSLRQGILDSLSAHDMPKAVQLYLQLQDNDSARVLPTQPQLDIANQLMAQSDYPQAAAAYELFLRTYPTYQQIAQVQLMLGLVYTRYLNQPSQARGHLTNALTGLPEDSPARQMCQTELDKIPPGDSPQP